MSTQEIVLPQRGASLGGFEVLGTAALGRHAAVLQARDADGAFVALKLGTTRVGAQLVEHEERVLRALDPHVGLPRLVGSGSDGDRPWCGTAWLRGAGAREVAAELRRDRAVADLVTLCSGVARGFGALHAQGVVHGQVHPRHVLVDRDGSVSLIDLSVAASPTVRAPAGRLEARFGTLGAPEQAAALLRGDELEQTAAAEQFSVAALLYLLFTGRMYARLRLEREVLPHDVAEASPVPFSEHGLPSSPGLETVLGRALRRDPAERFGSLDGLADALDSLAADAPAPARVVASSALTGMLETFRREASGDDTIASLVGPTCSINFGATGVAFALTRIGTVTGDASAFAEAERWLAAADRLAANPDAFDDGDQLTPQTIGTISPFHTRSGLPTARAFLARATGDEVREQAALEEFLETTAAACSNLDITLGRSSVLLVAALLLAGANRDWPVTQRLVARGDELCAGIWRDAAGEQLVYHGIAHGWAGLAYAALMWAQARGGEPPTVVRPVLERLAQLAEPFERGVRWPVSPPGGPSPGQFWPGWCHGNAGYVFLWNLAEASYGDGAFAELASRAAWRTDGPAAVTSLCCGTAGQAYAALSQYRSTGEARWLSLAGRLAERGASEDALAGDATTPLSLYKGHVGLALLAAELEAPERAAMPLFEFEPAQT